MTREDIRQRIIELRKDRSHHLIDESDYIESVLGLIDSYVAEKVLEAKQSERISARKLYAKRNPTFTKQWIAGQLGISRPTLNKWIDDPEQFTIGAIRKLATLQAEKEKL